MLQMGPFTANKGMIFGALTPENRLRQEAKEKREREQAKQRKQDEERVPE